MPLITFGSTSTGRRLARWLCAGAAAFGLPPAHAQSMSYALDPGHTLIQWEVQHFGTSTSRGRFTDVQGQVRLDPAAGTGEVAIVVGTASVSSGVPVLDGILRGDDFLNAKAYPRAYFVSRQVRFENGRPAELRGELTLRDVSMPFSLRATHFNCYEPPDRPGQTVCGGDFEGELIRAEAGIIYGLPFVGNRVRLRVQVEGTRL